MGQAETDGAHMITIEAVAAGSHRDLDPDQAAAACEHQRRVLAALDALMFVKGCWVAFAGRARQALRARPLGALWVTVPAASAGGLAVSGRGPGEVWVSRW